MLADYIELIFAAETKCNPKTYELGVMKQNDQFQLY